MEVKVRDIPVYYEVRGEGRPLLLLHGWPTDHHHMVHDFEPFFERRGDWKRVYLDLPGMGRTPSAEWITNQDGMLEVVLAFIDALIPGERVAVVGTSYGGYLAQGVAHHRTTQLDGLLLLVPQLVASPREPTAPPPITLVPNTKLKAELAPDEQ
jgi:pimeloyl-ACP methyl ester carboxylesterase